MVDGLCRTWEEGHSVYSLPSDRLGSLHSHIDIWIIMSHRRVGLKAVIAPVPGLNPSGLFVHLVYAQLDMMSI